MGSARGFPACGERPHRRFPDQKGVFSGPFSRWTCGGITHQAPHGPILGILPRSICWGWIGWPVPNDRWRSPADFFTGTRSVFRQARKAIFPYPAHISRFFRTAEILGELNSEKISGLLELRKENNAKKQLDKPFQHRYSSQKVGKSVKKGQTVAEIPRRIL